MSNTATDLVVYGGIELSRGELIDMLFTEYSSVVYRIGYKIVRNSADASDVVGETFLRAINKYDGVENKQDSAFVRSWLLQIARHYSLDLLKKKCRGEIELTDCYCKPSYEEYSINKVSIHEAISKIPNQQQYEAVILRDIKELSYEEAAQEMKIDVPSFKCHLHRGRLAVQKTLTKEFND